MDAEERAQEDLEALKTLANRVLVLEADVAVLRAAQTRMNQNLRNLLAALDGS